MMRLHLVVDTPRNRASCSLLAPASEMDRGSDARCADMVITSLSHDLKSEVAQNAVPQDWIFALVSLQTMEGLGGAGHYGVARMNGGSSSRAMLALAPAGQGRRVGKTCIAAVSALARRPGADAGSAAPSGP